MDATKITRIAQFWNAMSKGAKAVDAIRVFADVAGSVTKSDLQKYAPAKIAKGLIDGVMNSTIPTKISEFIKSKPVKEAIRMTRAEYEAWARKNGKTIEEQTAKRLIKDDASRAGGTSVPGNPASASSKEQTTGDQSASVQYRKPGYSNPNPSPTTTGGNPPMDQDTTLSDLTGEDLNMQSTARQKPLLFTTDDSFGGDDQPEEPIITVIDNISKSGSTSGTLDRRQTPKSSTAQNLASQSTGSSLSSDLSLLEQLARFLRNQGGNPFINPIDNSTTIDQSGGTDGDVSTFEVPYGEIPIDISDDDIYGSGDTESKVLGISGDKAGTGNVTFGEAKIRPSAGGPQPQLPKIINALSPNYPQLPRLQLRSDTLDNWILSFGTAAKAFTERYTRYKNVGSRTLGGHEASNLVFSTLLNFDATGAAVNDDFKSAAICYAISTSAEQIDYVWSDNMLKLHQIFTTGTTEEIKQVTANYTVNNRDFNANAAIAERILPSLRNFAGSHTHTLFTMLAYLMQLFPFPGTEAQNIVADGMVYWVNPGASFTWENTLAPLSGETVTSIRHMFVMDNDFLRYVTGVNTVAQRTKPGWEYACGGSNVCVIPINYKDIGNADSNLMKLASYLPYPLLQAHMIGVQANLATPNGAVGDHTVGNVWTWTRAAFFRTNDLYIDSANDTYRVLWVVSGVPNINQLKNSTWKCGANTQKIVDTEAKVNYYYLFEPGTEVEPASYSMSANDVEAGFTGAMNRVNIINQITEWIGLYGNSTDWVLANNLVAAGLLKWYHHRVTYRRHGPDADAADRVWGYNYVGNADVWGGQFVADSKINYRLDDDKFDAGVTKQWIAHTREALAMFSSGQFGVTRTEAKAGNSDLAIVPRHSGIVDLLIRMGLMKPVDHISFVTEQYKNRPSVVDPGQTPTSIYELSVSMACVNQLIFNMAGLPFSSYIISDTNTWPADLQHMNTDSSLVVEFWRSTMLDTFGGISTFWSVRIPPRDQISDDGANKAEWNRCFSDSKTVVDLHYDFTWVPSFVSVVTMSTWGGMDKLMPLEPGLILSDWSPNTVTRANPVSVVSRMFANGPPTRYPNARYYTVDSKMAWLERLLFTMPSPDDDNWASDGEIAKLHDVFDRFFYGSADVIVPLTSPFFKTGTYMTALQTTVNMKPTTGNHPNIGGVIALSYTSIPGASVPTGQYPGIIGTLSNLSIIITNDPMPVNAEDLEFIVTYVNALRPKVFSTRTANAISILDPRLELIATMKRSSAVAQLPEGAQERIIQKSRGNPNY